jgi:hypothetical protein
MSDFPVNVWTCPDCKKFNRVRYAGDNVTCKWCKSVHPVGILARCDDCGQLVTSTAQSCGTGYGTVDDQTVCYGCMAERDRVRMMNGETVYLYARMTGKSDHMCWSNRHTGSCEIANWPGTLKFTGRIVEYRRENTIRVWFKGPDGKIWYGQGSLEFGGVAVRPLKNQ